MKKEEQVVHLFVEQFDNGYSIIEKEDGAEIVAEVVEGEQEDMEKDLEEDINDFLNEEYRYTEYEGKWVDEKDWRDSIQRCARHFFELGLKTKGE